MSIAIVYKDTYGISVISNNGKGISDIIFIIIKCNIEISR